MTLTERARLIAVARGSRPADLYVRGATMLNVYTGEIVKANVATAGERIAYVGTSESMLGRRTRVLEVPGRMLVPGYIDPHVHPAHLVTPSALARHVLPLGTTSVFADTLQFWELGGVNAFRIAADALARSPLKFYWMIRVHGQSRTTDEGRRFPVRAVRRALEHPWAVALGEITRWPELRAADRGLLARLQLADDLRLRVEGHTAGASAEKLVAIAASGVSSDHEPITADEVLERARLGIAVMLRESSLRPDLAGLLPALERAPHLTSRLMLTADGAMPAFIETHGFTDHSIRVALDGGLEPVDAYRMATLNPATYFHRDADLGSIAPGRYADLCVLADLAEPTPDTVIARGRVVASGRRLIARVPEPPWRRIFTSPRSRLAPRWRCRAEDFALPARERYPVIRLISAVITRLEQRPLMPDDTRAALVDRAGRWIAPAVLAGFADRVDGLAATTTTDFNIITLGRRPESMARAVNRVLELGGGIVLMEGSTAVFEARLPIGGVMAPGTLSDAARWERDFHAAMRERGYVYHDPLFTLFFMAADFLPAVRLSPRGVWDVKAARVLLPSRRRPRA